MGFILTAFVSVKHGVHVYSAVGGSSDRAHGLFVFSVVLSISLRSGRFPFYF